MSDARYEIETLMRKHAVEGSWKVDVWELGSTRRFMGMVEWMRENEPICERVTCQGPRSRDQALDELLAAVCMRLRGKT